MNFVKQHDHFASMIAVCENGIEKLGYILDVTEDELYWGGPECGVFCNDQQWRLRKSSFGGGIVRSGRQNVAEQLPQRSKRCEKSLGVRIYGSSGIEFIHVLTERTFHISRICARGTMLPEKYWRRRWV